MAPLYSADETTLLIAIDAHLSENKPTGIGRYINGLVSALLRHHCQHKLLLLVRADLQNTHPLLNLDSQHVNVLPTSLSGTSAANLFMVDGLIRSFNPDIYHHPHFDLPLFVRCPSVITVHDLKYVTNPNFFFGGLANSKSQIMKWLLARSVKCADKVLAVSDSTKKDILRVFPKTNPAKILTTHLGVDDFLERNSVEPTHRAASLKPYILFVGERRPHKNIVLLIKAFAELKIKFESGLKLLIVGKKYRDYREPETLIEQLNLSRAVRIFDDVSDHELASFYENAEVFVFPSLYEGFGFPVLEAMRFGVPVISSDKTSLPEIVGRAAIIIDPRSTEQLVTAIRSVLGNKETRRRLVEKGFERVKSFSWKKTAEKTMAVYESIAIKTKK